MYGTGLEKCWKNLQKSFEMSRTRRKECYRAHKNLYKSWKLLNKSRGDLKDLNKSGRAWKYLVQILKTLEQVWTRFKES